MSNQQPEDGFKEINQQMPGAQQERWVKARENFKEVTSWLESTFPKAFDFSNPIPLKKGIRQDLLAKEPPFSKDQVNNALKAYVRSYPYLKAIIRYQWRHDLNGQQVEEILEEEKKYSKQILLFRKERRYGKKTQANAGDDIVRKSQKDTTKNS